MGIGNGFPRRRELCLAIVIAFGLSGCGGGGGGNGNVRTTTPTTPTTPSQPSTPQPPIDAQLTLTDTNAEIGRAHV